MSWEQYQHDAYDNVWERRNKIIDKKVKKSTRIWPFSLFFTAISIFNLMHVKRGNSWEITQITEGLFKWWILIDRFL